MEKSKKSNTRKRKNSVKPIKKVSSKKVRKTNKRKSSVNNIKSLTPASKNHGVAWILLLVLAIFTVFTTLFMGYSSASFIGDAKELSETNPNWYCDDINEYYKTDICWIKSDDLNINGDGGFVYILDCSWGDFAIKTTQEKVTIQDRLLLGMHGCKISPADK